MKSEERKSRLVVEEVTKDDGREGIVVNFGGSIERFSAFVASVITSYRKTVVENFGPGTVKVVNESLKDFIDLEGTSEEVMEFPEKVYFRLKESGDLDVKTALESLLLNLLGNIKKNAESDTEND